MCCSCFLSRFYFVSFLFSKNIPFHFFHSNIIIFLSTCIFFFYFRHQTFLLLLDFLFFYHFPFEVFFLIFLLPFTYILFSYSLSLFKQPSIFFKIFFYNMKCTQDLPDYLSIVTGPTIGLCS